MAPAKTIANMTTPNYNPIGSFASGREGYRPGAVPAARGERGPVRAAGRVAMWPWGNNATEDNATAAASPPQSEDESLKREESFVRVEEQLVADVNRVLRLSRENSQGVFRTVTSPEVDRARKAMAVDGVSKASMMMKGTMSQSVHALSLTLTPP